MTIRFQHENEYVSSQFISRTGKWRDISGPWRRHQTKTFSALLAFWTGNLPVTGEFPAQRPATRGFDVFFDLRLSQQLSKQWKRWWFETLPRSLWRHCNDLCGRSRYYRQEGTRYYITQFMWDAITCSCSWHLFLPHKSSRVNGSLFVMLRGLLQPCKKVIRMSFHQE